MSTILVTGGAGFLGSHIVEKMLLHGHRVVILDDFSTSSPGKTEVLRKHPSVVFINHDITEPFSYAENETLDAIYNFACPASPMWYQKDPLRTIRINTVGVINMLELARRHGALFVQASTSEVYGNPLVHPQPESYWGNVNPNGIRACYDEGKRIAETLVFEYVRCYSVPAKVVRIFNTYGPRMEVGDGRVVPNFIMQALKNEPITVYGQGQQTRSLCYVDDLIEGIYRFAHTTDAAFVGPVNVGNPHELSMLTLAKEIIRLTGSHSDIVFKPLPSDDPEKRNPVIDRLTSLTGWMPRVSLEEGLLKTIAYFKDQIGSI